MTATEQKIKALKDVAGSSAEYAEILSLFIAVFEYVSGKEGETGISIDLTAVNRAERTDNGFPLVSPLEVSVNQAEITAFLLGLIQVLTDSGKDAASELEIIASALKKDELDALPLLLAILERRRPPLDEAAERLQVPPPLLEYIFEIPLKTALEQLSATMESDRFKDWQEPVCPVCGSRPGIAELVGEEGKRLLSCSACNFRWAYKRLKCISCGNEDAEKLSYFTAGDGAVRVDTCSLCSRYIKTRDGRKGASDIPLEVVDLVTIHLDLLASREGFERGK